MCNRAVKWMSKNKPGNPCDLKITFFFSMKKGHCFSYVSWAKVTRYFMVVFFLLYCYVSCFYLMLYPALIKITYLLYLILRLIPVVLVLSWEDEKERASFLKKQCNLLSLRWRRIREWKSSGRRIAVAEWWGWNSYRSLCASCQEEGKRKQL